jgi:hypothetical protein
MPVSWKLDVCPEKRLLLCCARTRVQSGVAEQIQKLVAQPLDWAYLLSEAAENSVMTLLERQLSAVVPEAIPQEYLSQLKTASRANTVRCLYMVVELNRILELFESHRIPSIPYKGPVLAQQAYGDITLREFEDLDIVLRQRDLPRAHEILLGIGYRPKYPWILSPGAAASLVPGEYNYRAIERRIMVELHTERTLRHFPVDPCLDEFSQRLVPVRLSDRDVQTFCAEDALPILCIHGSKDFWERISWVADISELIQVHPQLDWDAVCQCAESVKANRMLYLGLTLARRLLGAPVPRQILKLATTDAAVSAVAKKVEARLLSRELIPLDAAGRFHFRRRLVPGSMAGWRYAIRLAVVPAEEDWMMVRLPAPLAPLYMALRPLRLLCKYGWTSRRAAGPSA